MRKFLLLIMCMMTFFLYGCTDQYRPRANSDEQWISTNPDISFTLLDSERNSSYGQMIVDGEVIEIQPSIDRGNILYIFSYITKDAAYLQDDDLLIWGECDFYEDMIVVTIKYDRDGIISDTDTITFFKQEEYPSSGKVSLQAVYLPSHNQNPS